VVTLIPCATREEAEAIGREVDRAMGYPAIGEGVCTAVRVGGGIHATHPECCTVRHAEVVEGPRSFAYSMNKKARTADSDAVREVIVTKGQVALRDFERKPEPTPEQIKATAVVRAR